MNCLHCGKPLPPDRPKYHEGCYKVKKAADRMELYYRQRNRNYDARARVASTPRPVQVRYPGVDGVDLWTLDEWKQYQNVLPPGCVVTFCMGEVLKSGISSTQKLMEAA